MTISHRDCGSYTILHFPALLLPFESHELAFQLSNITAWSLWSLYIFFQFEFARSLQKSTTPFIWRIWILVLAEFFLTFQDAITALNIILGLFSSKTSEPRPRYQLSGGVAPSVDVLITCCGEPIDVIVNTVDAASAQDYPLGRFNVFLLDDGQDDQLRHAVARLNVRLKIQKRPSVTYLSREKLLEVRSYFKAGNLRYGIEVSKRRSSSEFIAGLDADMIPDRDWLRKMVPHLLLDDKLALACPPQRYYNVPYYDPLGQQADFTMFFTFQEALNDRLGAAMCTGSGYVVRRSALEDIGGWPLAECGEDFMCSAVLGNAGWKIAFVREELQSGIAPNSMRAMVKQRMRWIDACAEVCQHFGYYLPGSAITSQMTPLQRAVNMLYAFRDYSPVTTSLALILLPIALLPRYPNDTPTPTSNASSTRSISVFWIQMLYVSTFLAHKINTYIMYNHVGQSQVQNQESQQVWLSPYMAYRCLISLLPSSLRTSTFIVCGATTSPTNERSSRLRLPLLARILAFPTPLYILYAFFASSSLILRLLSYDTTNPSIQDTESLLPLTGALVKMTVCIFKALVPVRYMVWPPTVPEREDLMAEDEEGVRRSKWDWEEKQGKSGNGIWWWFCLGCEIGVLLWCWR